MAERQWFGFDQQVHEEGVEEYFVLDMQINEDQADAQEPFLPYYPRELIPENLLLR